MSISYNDRVASALTHVSDRELANMIRNIYNNQHSSFFAAALDGVFNSCIHKAGYDVEEFYSNIVYWEIMVLG